MNTEFKSAAIYARLIELREGALSALGKAKAPFDTQSALAELDQLGQMHDLVEQADFLEVQIVALIAEGSQRGLCQKTLYRLFEARIKDRNVAQYYAFEQELKALGAKPAMVDQLFFHRTMGALNADEVFADIAKAIEILRPYGAGAFLNSGTLLGMVRDGKLIDYDDDVDLAIVFEAASPQQAAAKWQYLCETLKEAGHLKVKKRVRNPAVVKFNVDGPYNVDLFPGWVDGSHVHVYPHTYGDLTVDQLLPLRPCPVSGLPLPADAEAMLAVNYGEGWKSPEPGFKFRWKRANKRFETFLNALG